METRERWIIFLHISFTNRLTLGFFSFSLFAIVRFPTTWSYVFFRQPVYSPVTILCVLFTGDLCTLLLRFYAYCFVYSFFSILHFLGDLCILQLRFYASFRVYNPVIQLFSGDLCTLQLRFYASFSVYTPVIQLFSGDLCTIQLRFYAYCFVYTFFPILHFLGDLCILQLWFYASFSLYTPVIRLFTGDLCTFNYNFMCLLVYILRRCSYFPATCPLYDFMLFFVSSSVWFYIY